MNEGGLNNICFEEEVDEKSFKNNNGKLEKVKGKDSLKAKQFSSKHKVETTGQLSLDKTKREKIITL